MSKGFTPKPKRRKTVIEEKISKEEKIRRGILNKLCRILEKGGQSCIAACFINNIILISDNEIHSSSTNKLAQYEIIQKTMKYFKFENNVEDTDLLEEIFLSLSLSKVKQSEKGAIKLNDNDINSLAREVYHIMLQEIQGEIIVTNEDMEVDVGYNIKASSSSSSNFAVSSTKESNPKKKNFMDRLFDILKKEKLISTEAEFNNIIQATKSVQFKLNEIEDISSTVDAKVKISTAQMPDKRYASAKIVLLARDIMKIREFLLDEKNKDDLLKRAFSEGVIHTGKSEEIDIRSIASGESNKAGKDLMKAALQNTSKPGYTILKFDIKEVHAEARMIGFLLSTGVISQDSKSNVYIAISKLCCHNCSLLIEATNKAVNQKIGYKDDHVLSFDYEEPYFVKGTKFKEIADEYNKLKLENPPAVREKGEKIIMVDISPSISSTSSSQSGGISPLRGKQSPKLESHSQLMVQPNQVEIVSLQKDAPSEESLLMVNRRYKIIYQKPDENKYHNAYNQRNNENYNYQTHDLEALAQALLKEKDKIIFAGIMWSDNFCR